MSQSINRNELEAMKKEVEQMTASELKKVGDGVNKKAVQSIDPLIKSKFIFEFTRFSLEGKKGLTTYLNEVIKLPHAPEGSFNDLLQIFKSELESSQQTKAAPNNKFEARLEKAEAASQVSKNDNIYNYESSLQNGRR